MGGLPVRTQKKARPRKHKQLEEYLKHMNILVAIRVLEALPVRAPAPLGGDEGHLTGNWRRGWYSGAPHPLAQIRTVCPAVLWKAELNQQWTQIFSCGDFQAKSWRVWPGFLLLLVKPEGKQINEGKNWPTNKNQDLIWGALSLSKLHMMLTWKDSLPGKLLEGKSWGCVRQSLINFSERSKDWSIQSHKVFWRDKVCNPQFPLRYLNRSQK